MPELPSHLHEPDSDEQSLANLVEEITITRSRKRRCLESAFPPQSEQILAAAAVGAILDVVPFAA